VAPSSDSKADTYRDARTFVSEPNPDDSDLRRVRVYAEFGRVPILVANDERPVTEGDAPDRRRS
jgi:hypothetical protein